MSDRDATTREGFGDVEAMPELLAAVGAAFGALGRVLVCLDGDFRVLHASRRLAELVGEARARGAVGHPVDELFGPGLFDETADMRQSLERGERREGWRAQARGAGSSPVVSLTAAPFIPEPGVPCDRRVKYILVVRPAETDDTTGTAAPTVYRGLVGRSPQMLQLFALVENLGHSTATVLLTGESGTGKEMVARAIHASSVRADGPFVAVNCGALHDQLLESELFGHVRGAFTGAVKDRVGRFEAAQGGTLFLDEIGELSLPLQVKLLRVLQERAYERLGETRTRHTDARIVAATNRDLARAVADGDFREDLYYRLRVLPIEVPPLRERPEDVAPLAHHLLARVAARQGRSVRLSPSTVRCLLEYRWPGNVRELENAIEYGVAVARGQTILPEDLPAEVVGELARGPRSLPEVEEPGAEDEDSERQTLLRALEQSRWKREDAARALGISRTTLWRKMREHGLTEG